MRSILLTAAVLFTGFGCAKTSTVEVTPEMEAEQKRNEKSVQDAESAMRKQQKPSKSQEEEVTNAESQMQRKSGR